MIWCYVDRCRDVPERLSSKGDVEVRFHALQQSASRQRGIEQIQFIDKRFQFGRVEDWAMSLDDSPSCLNAHPDVKPVPIPVIILVGELAAEHPERETGKLKVWFFTHG